MHFSGFSPLFLLVGGLAIPAVPLTAQTTILGVCVTGESRDARTSSLHSRGRPILRKAGLREVGFGHFSSRDADS